MMKTGEMDRNDVTARLRERQVPRAESLCGLATSSWRVATTPVQLEELHLGQSRFGGDPDLPPHIEWPTRDGRPLAFLAQIQLTEIASQTLPSTGWLLFFYDAEEQPWGFDPKDAAGSRVVYVSCRLEELVRRAHPTGFSFEPCSVALSEVLDLPHPWDRRVVDAGIEMTEEEEASYASVIAELSGVEEDAQYHHLLGHPQLIQSDMRGECELVAHGIYIGDPAGFTNALAKQLLPVAADKWELLLQLDSDESGLGWMWGDMGRLYFWIRRSDLAARTFDKTWLILQCG